MRLGMYSWVTVCNPCSYEHYLPDKKPALIAEPIPLGDHHPASTVYDYMYDKTKLK